MAELAYDVFPRAFCDEVENTSTRPGLSQRVHLLAKHMAPFISMPGYHFIKATETGSNKILGVATWMETRADTNFPTFYPKFDGIQFPRHCVPSPWCDDLVGPLALDKKMNWSHADVQKLHAHYSEGWFEEFRKYDTGRVKEMKDRFHWYLSPVCIKKEHRAKGIGKALTMWGIERADAADPPQPCVLETLPNVAPVYYHLGFESTAHHGTCKDTQLVRPPHGKGHK